MHSRYEIVIFWSDEDDCFIAEVPELAGCMAISQRSGKGSFYICRSSNIGE